MLMLTLRPVTPVDPARPLNQQNLLFLDVKHLKYSGRQAEP